MTIFPYKSSLNIIKTAEEKEDEDEILYEEDGIVYPQNKKYPADFIFFIPKGPRHPEEVQKIVDSWNVGLSTDTDLARKNKPHEKANYVKRRLEMSIQLYEELIAHGGKKGIKPRYDLDGFYDWYNKHTPNWSVLDFEDLIEQLSKMPEKYLEGANDTEKELYCGHEGCNCGHGGCNY